jgi:hypothetical protein
MTSLEYPIVVKSAVQRSLPSSLPSSLPLFAILLLPLVLVPICPAQNNGVPVVPAHAISVAPVSIPLPARSAPAPVSPVVTVPPKPPHLPNPPNGNNGGTQPRTVNNPAYYPYVYLVPVPYAVDASAPDAAPAPDVSDDGENSADSYVPAVSTSSAEASVEVAQVENAPATYPNPDPEPAQSPTILVFKDGHQIEVDNYAIVNQTLYDLTPGHPRKIALADLDLAATEKQDDDRGIVFQLPVSAQAN